MSEMIICKRKQPEPPPLPGVTRVTVMKILGVLIDNKLNFTPHVDNIVKTCNQLLFALKTLKNHGLSFVLIQKVFVAIFLAKMLYCICAWGSFTSLTNKSRLDALLRKSKMLNYYKANGSNIAELQQTADRKLFHKIVLNSDHVL